MPKKNRNPRPSGELQALSSLKEQSVRDAMLEVRKLTARLRRLTVRIVTYERGAVRCAAEAAALRAGRSARAGQAVDRHERAAAWFLHAARRVREERRAVELAQEAALSPQALKIWRNRNLGAGGMRKGRIERFRHMLDVLVFYERSKGQSERAAHFRSKGFDLEHEAKRVRRELGLVFKPQAWPPRPPFKKGSVYRHRGRFFVLTRTVPRRAYWSLCDRCGDRLTFRAYRDERTFLPPSHNCRRHRRVGGPQNDAHCCSLERTDKRSKTALFHSCGVRRTLAPSPGMIE